MHTPRANGYRDHWTGDVRSTDVGRTIRVAGWVHRRRDHGGLIFIDLRDRTGILQLVFHPDTADAFAPAERLRSEHVVSATGQVVARDRAAASGALTTSDGDTVDVTPEQRARGLVFAPAVHPSDRAWIRAAIARARPEAARLIAEVDGGKWVRSHPAQGFECGYK